MPEEMTPNMPPQPVAGDTPVAPVAPTEPVMPVDPVVPEAPVASAESSVPQNLDKSDAMTYPLGSQESQPVAEVSVEDHGSILDRIMGLFSRGKKEVPVETQAQMPTAPETPVPPVQQ
jgi:hypothetical protein